ncbi:hypothetical protein LSTR_LSTR000949 [Laodelphax striatellus]|uniref:FLYWCH-type domain-containing protein n=1 Tax=Laodelphax striatellus TaxID=195883 RepID=A0A482X0Y7_LAOST|nr:hypothetical protein LSTR_LSTR000949 [Laodelphax striatellus]
MRGSIPESARSQPLFSSTKRGSLKVLLKGHGYTVLRARGNGTNVWRCDKYDKYKCAAKLVTNANKQITEEIDYRLLSKNAAWQLARTVVPDISQQSDEADIPECDRDQPLFCQSNRGSLKLMLKGHAFNLRRVRGEVTVWRCNKFLKFNCPANVETAGQAVIKDAEHNHPPDWAKFKWEYILAQKKKSAPTKLTGDQPESHNWSIQNVRTITVAEYPLGSDPLDVIPLCDRDRPLYCKSNRGSLKLMLKGFGYNFRSSRGDINVWKCDKHTRFNCKVLAETDGDSIIKEPVHNHPPDWKKFAWEYEIAQRTKKA